MIPGLDGIRAIAFLLVFAMHTDYLMFGWVGVLLFFVLSGFLITDILIRMKETLPARAYFIKFYGRRFLRIFPLYYFYLFAMLLISALLLAAQFRPDYMRMFQDQVRYAIFYVYDFFSAGAGFVEHRFLGHFWSLSVEEQFYIVWPLAILLTPRKFYRQLFLGAIILGPLARFGLAYAFNHALFGLPYGAAPQGIYVLPFSHIDAFGLGAYISRFEIPRPRWQLAGLTILLPLAGYVSQFWATGSIGDPTALGFVHPLANNLKHVWGYSLLNYFFALLIYNVVKEKLFVRWLELPFLRYLGKISYGLYVYHYAIIWFVTRLRELNLPESLNKPLIALLSFALTLAVAALSYRWLEAPLIGLKDRYFANRPPGIISPKGISS
ncbi:MAG: hypothetical protein Fur0035_24660 [Anaerolineales bacterium]